MRIAQRYVCLTFTFTASVLVAWLPWLSRITNSREMTNTSGKSHASQNATAIQGWFEQVIHWLLIRHCSKDAESRNPMSTLITIPAKFKQREGLASKLQFPVTKVILLSSNPRSGSSLLGDVLTPRTSDAASKNSDSPAPTKKHAAAT